MECSSLHAAAQGSLSIPWSLRNAAVTSETVRFLRSPWAGQSQPLSSLSLSANTSRLAPRGGVPPQATTSAVLEEQQDGALTKEPVLSGSGSLETEQQQEEQQQQQQKPQQEHSEDVSSPAKGSKPSTKGVTTKGKHKAASLLPSLRSRRARDWDRALELCGSGQLWRSKVEALNAGGARLRFGSLLAFLPFSQLEPKRTLSATKEELVGTYVTVQVVEVDKSAGRMLVSERKAHKKLRLQGLKVGQVREGVVCGVMDYGVFVDLIELDGSLSGVGGLVHVSELSWDAVLSPSTVVSSGQRVRVKILRIEEGKNRLALSMKQVQSDPLVDTLDVLLPSGVENSARAEASSVSLLASQMPMAEELLGAPLPGLRDLCDSLRRQDGILEVSLGRQALERRVVSQDLELWLSSAPVKDGQFTLVARAGRQVQEVFVKSNLDREGMKQAVLNVTQAIP